MLIDVLTFLELLIYAEGAVPQKTDAHISVDLQGPFSGSRLRTPQSGGVTELSSAGSRNGWVVSVGSAL